MLYRTLRLVAGVALRWYYGEITLVGGERIPPSGPILVVVNHPNALVDALVIGWLVPRRIRITAKAVLFDNAMLGAFLRAVGVVPLRRASDERARRSSGRRATHTSGETPNVDASRNTAAFDALLDALDGGSAVLIFPEGKSHDSPDLEPLKTGPARIALAARDARRAGGLQVVPIALVFERKEAPRSRVLAVVGDALDIHAWQPPAHGRRTEALTAELDRRLRGIMLSAPSAARLNELQVMAAHVAEVLAPEPARVGAARSLHDEYVVATRLAHVLATIEWLPPDLQEQAYAAQVRMACFIESLRAAQIAPGDSAISLRKRHGSRFVMREFALLLLAGPVAMWGRMNHWIPFRAARRIALRDVTSRDQPAMRTIVAGLGMVVGAYVVQTAIAWQILGGWMALVYLVTLPFSADVDLRYSGRVRAALARTRAYFRLRRDPTLAAELVSERTALADEVRRLDARVMEAERRQPAGG